MYKLLLLDLQLFPMRAFATRSAALLLSYPRSHTHLLPYSTPVSCPVSPTLLLSCFGSFALLLSHFVRTLAAISPILSLLYLIHGLAARSPTLLLTYLVYTPATGSPVLLLLCSMPGPTLFILDLQLSKHSNNFCQMSYGLTCQLALYSLFIYFRLLTCTI